MYMHGQSQTQTNTCNVFMYIVCIKMHYSDVLIVFMMHVWTRYYHLIIIDWNQKPEVINCNTVHVCCLQHGIILSKT